MASGDSIFSGSFLGTGALVNVQTCPFKPDKVEIYNEDGLCKGVWQKSMADGDVLKTITDGTISMVNDDGITPLDGGGFSLGADTDLNVDGEKVHFTCHQ